jgi:predicted dienelactone hydrolase
MRAVRLGRNSLTRLLTGVAVCFGIYSGSVVWSAPVLAQDVLRAAPYPVGMIQLEYVDPSEGGRPLNLMLIYPAAPATTAVSFKIFMASNLHLYKDAPIVSDGLRRPLVMFSHGAGGNGSIYAWFGEYLASHGYLVAMAYHYRANTYDSSALYVRNRIWQRPRDISMDITNLLQDKTWGPHIDPSQIGVAGHSQGGIHLALDWRRQGESRPFPAVSARLEEQRDRAGVYPRADEP